MGTRALARFGVYGRASTDERDVLNIADEYRRELCALYHEQHRATLDLRERRFPGLFAAMVRREAIGAAIVRVEREIKAHHSKVRDRNEVPTELADQLRALRTARSEATTEIVGIKPQWLAVLKDVRSVVGDATKPSEDATRIRSQWFHAIGERAPKDNKMKNCKSITGRERLYALIQWPEHLQEYGVMWIGFDMRRRRLGERYQSLGLHYTIRAEIEAASKPKLTKDGPGMRYSYHRNPEPRPWEKMTLQFGSGGLTVQDALEGTPQFSLTAIYSNHPCGGDETVYEVTQQIGNSESPHIVSYRTKLHRQLPENAVIQRWSFIVRPDGRRECVPIISGINFTRPTESGTVTYDLTWTVVRGGVQVCSFNGDHVNERLVIPQLIVDNRMAMKPAQEQADNAANELLEQRGIARSKKPGPNVLFGLAALADYCASHPDDDAAVNTLDQLTHDVRRAERTAAKARRCIEKIYETVASRVCRLHNRIVPDALDLKRAKQYDARDLLREDVLPSRSREILFAVAPGKLRALLDGYGLASVDMVPPDMAASRKTDLFTSYVNNLGRATGTKPAGKCHRSQHAVLEAVSQ